MKKLTMLLVSLAFVASADSFSKSKNSLLEQVYHDNKVTFYCNAPFEVATKGDEKKMVIVSDTARSELAKDGTTSTQNIEWNHIMPIENAIRHLECWKTGGRTNCENDPVFKRMQADMHNLVPVLKDVNSNKNTLKYTTDNQQKTFFDKCGLDPKTGYPKDEIKGATNCFQIVI